MQKYRGPTLFIIGETDCRVSLEGWLQASANGNLHVMEGASPLVLVDERFYPRVNELILDFMDNVEAVAIRAMKAEEERKNKEAERRALEGLRGPFNESEFIKQGDWMFNGVTPKTVEGGILLQDFSKRAKAAGAPAPQKSRPVEEDEDGEPVSRELELHTFTAYPHQGYQEHHGDDEEEVEEEETEDEEEAKQEAVSPVTPQPMPVATATVGYNVGNQQQPQQPLPQQVFETTTLQQSVEEQEETESEGEEVEEEEEVAEEGQAEHQQVFTQQQVVPIQPAVEEAEEEEEVEGEEEGETESEDEEVANAYAPYQANYGVPQMGGQFYPTGMMGGGNFNYNPMGNMYANPAGMMMGGGNFNYNPMGMYANPAGMMMGQNNFGTAVEAGDEEEGSDEGEEEYSEEEDGEEVQ